MTEVSRRQLLVAGGAAMLWLAHPTGARADGETAGGTGTEPANRNDHGAAAALSAPTGAVLLTVRGPLPVRNHPEGAAFDYDMLRTLGEASFTTQTPWRTLPTEFRGLPLFRLTERLGIRGGTLIARASNDYSIPVPVSDAVPGGPILAWQADGKTLSLRNQGPLWLIYPFDEVPAYRTEMVYARSIWQLYLLDWLPPALAGDGESPQP